MDDSKKLSPLKREGIFESIQRASNAGKLVYGVGMIDAATIDRVGIREANRLAMAEAIHQVFLQIPPEQITKIQIDGRDNYRFDGVDPEKLEYVVRGDGYIKEIQAASILAKVSRDRLMIEYAKTYPDYRFEKHKGYGTALHFTALHLYGYTDIHRKSYKPIKDLISQEFPLI